MNTSSVSRKWVEAGAAGLAVGMLIAWLLLCLRVSAPINRQLIAAADSGVIPSNAQVLQGRWDSVVYTRAVLQGLAVTALCLTLLS